MTTLSERLKTVKLGGQPIAGNGIVTTVERYSPNADLAKDCNSASDRIAELETNTTLLRMALARIADGGMSCLDMQNAAKQALNLTG